MPDLGLLRVGAARKQRSMAVSVHRFFTMHSPAIFSNSPFCSGLFMDSPEWRPCYPLIPIVGRPLAEGQGSGQVFPKAGPLPRSIKKDGPGCFAPQHGKGRPPRFLPAAWKRTGLTHGAGGDSEFVPAGIWGTRGRIGKPEAGRGIWIFGADGLYLWGTYGRSGETRSCIWHGGLRRFVAGVG